MDSTTLLYDLIDQGNDVRCLSFNYGQRHQRELEKAAISTKKLGIHHQVVTFNDSMLGLLDNSALTGQIDVPEGHYEDESMKITVVPNRNMILLSLAIGYAINNNIDRVAYAAHAGDHTIYPDCRPAFISAMRYAASLCHFHPVRIDAPYANIDKAEICAIGLRLGVPYEDTWTCYKGGAHPCGVCGSCQERAYAFSKSQGIDPLI
jgi:7-cyano-7-deazaguanine synthase